MSDMPKQGASVPLSAPVNYERLYVRGVEVDPEATAKGEGAALDRLDHIKRIPTSGEINVSLLAKSFNALLDDLEDKGYMKKR